MPVTPSNKE